MRFLNTLFASGAFVLVACSGGAGGSGDASESTGQTTLAISVVPANVQCVQITVSGQSTVTSPFAVTPGASSVGLSLGNLPLGTDTITGQAYAAPCASIAGTAPAYVADPQTVKLAAGVVSSLTMTFRPDNSVSGTASFVGNVVAVDATYEATFLVMSDGTVEAAGNTFITSSRTFVPVPGLTGVAHVAGGYGFDCALLTSGSVECWGTTNYVGQLGNGTTTASTTPSPASGVTNAVAIAAGYAHACVLTSNGATICWGLNGSGQLGSGSTTNSATPLIVSYQFTQISLGEFSTCGVTNYGAVDCAGDNLYGELGNNTTTNSSYFTPTTGEAATVAVAAGGTHACALRADGTLRCWGQNIDGQLGNGTTTQSNVPVLVPLNGITRVTASHATTCAQNASGVYCWGEDSFGEVGDGTGTNGSFPVLVSLPSSAPVVSLSSDPYAYTFCALLADQTIDCWGQNSFGQLGNGTIATSFVPTAIAF